MNVKSIFGTIGDTLSGLFGVLTGLVGVGIMSQVIFGIQCFRVKIADICIRPHKFRYCR